MQGIQFDNDEHKEICTQFGLAAFLGQVLESLLVTILLGNAKAEGTAVTAQDLDTLEDQLQKKETLGTLVRKVREQVAIADQTEQLIAFAVKKRNFLIHHFFREHAFDLSSEDGRHKMVTELHEMQRVFLAAKKLAEDLLAGIAKALGITQEMLAADVEQLRRTVEAP